MAVRVVGAYIEPTDGMWHAALSDGQHRAQGVGKTLVKALQDAEANFANGPTRLPLYPASQPRPVLHPLAYVDATSTREHAGDTWLEVLAWGESLGTLATIETLDGRTGVPLAAAGAKVMQWRRRCWINVVAVPPETPTDIFDETDFTDASFFEED